MKNNNFRLSGLAIALTAMSGMSGGANAALELYSTEGTDGAKTSFSVDGYFNTFYVNRDDKQNDLRTSDVKMGFLPNTIGFNFSKDVGDLTLGGRSSFWATINDSLNNPTDTAIDVRQFYATVDGDFGQVLIGKDFGLYSRSNIFLDEILLGFGSPGLNPNGVSFGNIRAGYEYPTPSAQITYRTPDLSGFKLAVGVLEPANTTGAAQSEESAPRLEAEATYSADLNGLNLTAWVNGLQQSSESATTEVDTTGVGYGVKASIAGLTLAASGFTSEGTNGILLVNGAFSDDNEADGFLVQGSYTLGANRLVLSYGETDAVDAGYLDTENTSIALFHDVNSNLKLVGEYNMYEGENAAGATAEEVDTIALGAVVLF
ncbi:MAG: porin [Marinobacter sp.]|uniref:porin n=1 Tax=Marinobacter sp. TaxID=50741 RepID=UPI00299D9C45|nr:porin [Marinobacter sp.]MDX1633306.1 porin [Marinobacter sp.]